MNRYYSLIQKKSFDKVPQRRNKHEVRRRKYDSKTDTLSSSDFNISPSSSYTSISADNHDSAYCSTYYDIFEGYLHAPDYAELNDLNRKDTYAMLKPPDDSVSITSTPECHVDSEKHQLIIKDFDFGQSNPEYRVTQCGKVLTQMKAHPYIYYDSSHPGMEELMKTMF